MILMKKSITHNGRIAHLTVSFFLTGKLISPYTCPTRKIIVSKKMTYENVNKKRDSVPSDSCMWIV